MYSLFRNIILRNLSCYNLFYNNKEQKYRQIPNENCTGYNPHRSLAMSVSSTVSDDTFVLRVSTYFKPLMHGYSIII